MSRVPFQVRIALSILSMLKSLILLIMKPNRSRYLYQIINSALPLNCGKRRAYNLSDVCLFQ